MRNIKKFILILSIGIFISILTISCDPMYTNNYTLENNSDSTLFVSVKRTYINDSITSKLISYNWQTIHAHTSEVINRDGMRGKIKDDQLNYFGNSIKLTLDTILNIKVKKDINNFVNWKRIIINNTNEYTFSVATSELK
jgi:hypothetical protein